MSAHETISAPEKFDWRSFDAYLFDIDGTLLNARDGVHYNAFHAALVAAFGCHQKIDNIPVHGNTDIGILRATAALGGVTDGDFEAKLPEMLQIMSAEVERNKAGIKAEVCPSIPRLLEELRTAGKLLGVTSGNIEPIGWTKLRAAGLADYFSFGSYSDRNPTRVEIFRYGARRAKELTGQDATVCFIGDTPNDIAAARDLGMPIIAVATGVYSSEELAKHAPELCVSCCDVLWD